MALSLSILYRGPLSSCNYGCDYCPFAKRHETATELAVDRRALERFTTWVAGRDREHDHDRIAILFTPWGEALTRRWYRDALVRLTNRPHVERAAILTNLAAPLDWVGDCDLRRLALWTTYHPTQVPRATFLAQCQELDRRGVRYSVGVVGLRDQIAEAQAIRHELPPHVYVWINAYKPELGDYTEDELRQLEAIDPLFPVNAQRHPSLGRSCRAGRSVISVDGDGTIRRCHFIREPIGNLYDPGFEACLVERPCTNATCSCHIGYVHLDHLELYPVFGPGVLERIPREPIWQRKTDQVSTSG
jgi:MoaA/NifB/PqqE/SkfB family radical SAM enzyme